MKNIFLFFYFIVITTLTFSQEIEIQVEFANNNNKEKVDSLIFNIDNLSISQIEKNSFCDLGSNFGWTFQNRKDTFCLNIIDDKINDIKMISIPVKGTCYGTSKYYFKNDSIFCYTENIICSNYNNTQTVYYENDKEIPGFYNNGSNYVGEVHLRGGYELLNYIEEQRFIK